MQIYQIWGLQKRNEKTNKNSENNIYTIFTHITVRVYSPPSLLHVNFHQCHILCYSVILLSSPTCWLKSRFQKKKQKNKKHKFIQKLLQIYLLLGLKQVFQLQTASSCVFYRFYCVCCRNAQFTPSFWRDWRLWRKVFCAGGELWLRGEFMGFGNTDPFCVKAMKSDSQFAPHRRLFLWWVKSFEHVMWNLYEPSTVQAAGDHTEFGSCLTCCHTQCWQIFQLLICAPQILFLSSKRCSNTFIRPVCVCVCVWVTFWGAALLCTKVTESQSCLCKLLQDQNPLESIR